MAVSRDGAQLSKLWFYSFSSNIDDKSKWRLDLLSINFASNRIESGLIASLRLELWCSIIFLRQSMPLGCEGCSDYVITGRARAVLMICKWTYSHTHTLIPPQETPLPPLRYAAQDGEPNPNERQQELSEIALLLPLGLWQDRTRQAGRQAGRQGAIKSGAEIS